MLDDRVSLPLSFRQFITTATGKSIAPGGPPLLPENRVYVSSASFSASSGAGELLSSVPPLVKASCTSEGFLYMIIEQDAKTELVKLGTGYCQTKEGALVARRSDVSKDLIAAGAGLQITGMSDLDWVFRYLCRIDPTGGVSAVWVGVITAFEHHYVLLRTPDMRPGVFVQYSTNLDHLGLIRQEEDGTDRIGDHPYSLFMRQPSEIGVGLSHVFSISCFSPDCLRYSSGCAPLSPKPRQRIRIGQAFQTGNCGSVYLVRWRDPRQAVFPCCSKRY